MSAADDIDDLVDAHRRLVRGLQEECDERRHDRSAEVADLLAAIHRADTEAAETARHEATPREPRHTDQPPQVIPSQPPTPDDDAYYRRTSWLV
ncbi:hypothetical protein [Nocardia transvalensis]|uniref:hypothetical protein n=1 Tax=Nocardia transvalensis TaxID=37333 RepID=UPI00189322A5|nr:hypothetical protein [Nocardia transvalensis]MBF6327449.1 hypothetical protein [Nocardia transvalensis]